MKGSAGPLKGAFGIAAAALLVLCLGIVPDVRAQQSADADADAGSEIQDASDETLYSAEELDQLVAPIALYPDSLLAQVLVAATYPLDIVKADRWVEANQDLPKDQRADAAQSEGWDPSVVVLAAGFPTLIDRMADELDWTEALGDALLAQNDDVLDAVQRQRARAAAAGNLESNDAQVVTVEDDNITVTPADPEVVYVPAYDSATAYAAPVAGAPVIVDQNDPGYSAGALIATGVVSFGLGMLVDEIFHDDDWDDWHGYWGPRRFDWDHDNFYPRPGVNVGGDVIVNVDRDNIDLGDRGEAWRPDREREDRARQKIEQRKEGRQEARPSLGEGRTPLAGGADRSAIESKLKARSGTGGGKLQQSKNKASLPKKKGAAGNAVFSGSKGGLTKTKKAASRAKASKAEAKLPSRSKKLAAANAKKPKQSLGSKSGGKQSLFKKKGGGAKAQKAKARGQKSGGKKFKHRK